MNSTSFPKPASPGFNLSGGGSFNHADRSASLSTASPSKPNSSESSSSSEGKKKGGISSDIEEFLAELTMENSSAPVDFGLPSTPNAAAKQLAAAIDLEEMDNEDKGEDETAEVSDPWALAPNEWPQMEEEKPQVDAGLSLDDYEIKKAKITLHHLSDLRDHISRLTNFLRMGDGTAHIKLVADEFDEKFDFDFDLYNKDKETFLTEVPGQQPEDGITGGDNKKQPKKSEKKEEDAAIIDFQSNPLMIENVKFPEVLRCEPLLFPNMIVPATIMNQALQSRNYTPGVLRRWKRKLLHPVSQTIFTNLFWFHLRQSWKQLATIIPRKQEETNNMGGEKEETYKNKLLSFVCQEYVKLFAEMKGAADKDDFFAAFPDIVAQAIYIAYCECFPLSIAIFDVKFQEDLAETIGEALSGLKPYKAVRVPWKIIHKKDGNEKKEDYAFKLEETINTASIDLDKQKQDKKNNSAAIGASLLQTQRIPFDVYSNSPIVNHYLNEFGSKIERRHLKIHRSEVVKDARQDPDLQTYRQVLTESVKTSKRQFKTYVKGQDEIQRERNKIQQEFSAQIHKEEKKAWKILSRPQQLKEAANMIVRLQENRQMRKKAAAVDR